MTKRTPLHRINAGIKMLFLLGFSTAAFFLNLACSCILSAALILTAFAAGINPLRLLRGSRPVIFLGIFVALGRALNFSPPFFETEGFFSGLMFLWGMLLSFCAGALLFAVTTMAELREAAANAERVLLMPSAALLKEAKCRYLRNIYESLRRPKLGLALSLMMGFIPRFFVEWESLCGAYRARAGKRGVTEIKTLIPIAVNRMIDMAVESASALEARGALL
ncbi:MAG: energy-coupling factor transporter transmembrane protein EcfT [Treponema sp.]|jgi:energy-coupling factor transporter transmembrane protein EcfT|nr:energy-coupling factor transporter transmembrane protein EcfT [Treponema sp.]